MGASVTPLRLGLTYDLRDDYLAMGYSEIATAELDQASTIESLISTLSQLGYAVDPIGHVKQLAARLVAGERWDLVFNICEGMHGIGREAQVPALLDAYQIPYVFSDTLVCALTLHKGMTKDVVRAAGVPTPDYAVVHNLADLQNITLAYPLFAKPIAEGTGKGVSADSKITNAKQLQRVCKKLLREFQQPVLVERFLPGREFTVGIVGTGNAAVAVGAMEIQLQAGADNEVYSFHNKENWEQLVRYQLLEPSPLREQAEAVALGAWRALGCRDGGRIDVRADHLGQVNFIEVNPLAGIHPTYSDLPIMNALAGNSYQHLLGRIMQSALQRLPKPSAKAVAA
ncbi:D-alanine--D-alanine ligase [Dasania sp. GY-MA-18]|uniref:D-alanine--D-alanine ligase n=1 Tax=Dasania phycosphaerae TaxID=2950436 RepID=A0A9J6RJN4_9GAMM|nr:MULTISPECIES: D-alanine--D-alanine ligase [Dasania]MCR8922466.1 D-alanine--D-alanine ligase [Dasania sp. GY-MA-18]MCZ0864894.1 D-alanine--D-alanine ligase [Dasania phycosphaerae]MCZ0868622.1 D-alanine--D-alanine ligase [Dasania phycosphaerae]